MMKKTFTAFVWMGGCLLLGVVSGMPSANAEHHQARLMQETLASAGGPAGGGNPVSVLAVVGEPVGGWASRGGARLWAGFKPPLPGLPPGTRTVVVEGTVDDPRALVVVNGVAASRQGTSFHATGIRLLEGPNLIRVTAIDLADNQASREMTVWLDTHPPARPTVVVPPPLAGPSTHRLTGTKTPGASLWINGREVLPLSDATEWSVEVPLIEGDNVFTIVAKDAAGNVSSTRTITILLDNLPPVLSAFTLRDPDGVVLRLDQTTQLPRTNFDLVVVQGDVDDSHTVVAIDGVLAGRAGRHLTLALPLTAGANAFELIATSPHGHVTRHAFQVLRGTIPTITALTPADASLAITERPVSVTATATDREGNPIEYQLVVDGQVLMDWASTASAIWTPTQTQDGLHVIAVRVRDGFGGLDVRQAEVFVVPPARLPP